MIYIILTTIIIFTNILLYLQYTFFFLYWISYFLAYIPYYLNVRKDIINYNIKTFLPDLTKKKIDHLNFQQYKFFILNILIGINQYLFKNSLIIKNYSKNNLILPNKKCLIIQAHQGIYYDIFSFYNLIGKKSFYGIYKGNFKFRFKGKIKCEKHSKIDFYNLKKYFCIYTPIDQKSGDKTLVNFLGKNVNFHSKLLDYSITTNRDIYFYYTIVENNLIKPNLVKIITKNKNLQQVVQDVADKSTEIIKKYPEQYLWCHDRFNFKKK